MHLTQATDKQSLHILDEQQLQKLKKVWSKLGETNPESIPEGEALSLALSRLFLGVTIAQITDCLSE